MTNLREMRCASGVILAGGFSSRSTRRPSTERKPGSAIARELNHGRASSCLANRTRQAASKSWPWGTIRHASSAAISPATRHRRRAHHTSGCHHRPAAVRSANHCQAVSPAATCATSWASIASSSAGLNSSPNVGGITITGRNQPQVIGLANRCDCPTRTPRATPNRKASRRTRCWIAGSAADT